MSAHKAPRRSLLNPDKLTHDCDVAIHIGFDSTWDRVRSLLKLERLIADCADEINAECPTIIGL